MHYTGLSEIHDSSHLWMRFSFQRQLHVLTSEKEITPWTYLGFMHQIQISSSPLEIVCYHITMKWIFLQCQRDLAFLIVFCSSSPGEENVQILAISTINRYSLIVIFHDMILEVIHINVGFKTMCQRKHLTSTCTCTYYSHDWMYRTE